MRDSQKKEKKPVSKEKQIADLGKAAREKIALSFCSKENDGPHQKYDGVNEPNSNEEIVVIIEENNS